MLADLYLRTRGRGCRSPGFVLSWLCPGSRATGCPILLHFLYSFPIPLSSAPIVWSMFVPRRRSQQGVVDSRTVTTLSLLLETSPFIGPNSLSLDNYISRDQYVTSGAGSCLVVHTFSTFYTFFTLIIGFLVPSSFVPLSLYTNTIFSTLLIGFFVPSSLLPSSVIPPPVVPRPVVPCPVVPRPVVPCNY